MKRVKAKCIKESSNTRWKLPGFQSASAMDKRAEVAQITRRELVSFNVLLQESKELGNEVVLIYSVLFLFQVIITSKSSNASFLFSLRNPSNLAPFKCPIINGKNGYAIWCHPSYGAIFGRGHDLVHQLECQHQPIAQTATLVTHTSHPRDINMAPNKPSHSWLAATNSNQQKLKYFTE